MRREEQLENMPSLTSRFVGAGIMGALLPLGWFAFAVAPLMIFDRLANSVLIDAASWQLLPWLWSGAFIGSIAGAMLMPLWQRGMHAMTEAIAGVAFVVGLLGFFPLYTWPLGIGLLYVLKPTLLQCCPTCDDSLNDRRRFELRILGDIVFEMVFVATALARQ